jgi:hypothetical protein
MVYWAGSFFLPSFPSFVRWTGILYCTGNSVISTTCGCVRRATPVLTNVDALERSIVPLQRIKKW